MEVVLTETGRGQMVSSTQKLFENPLQYPCLGNPLDRGAENVGQVALFVCSASSSTKWK